MLVAIIDYGSGNLRSAEKAFSKVAQNSASIFVTANPEDLQKATHIVLPGVGAFADCMQGITAISGMRDILNKEVLEHKKPFFGICVGMQMLFETGYEYGAHKGFGWLKGDVKKIEVNSASLKIPHMGWNDLKIKLPDHALLNGINTGDHAYFVHSYHAICKDRSDMLATVEYGEEITAIVARGNIMGTQFHPEKSQEVGLRLIKNFLEIK